MFKVRSTLVAALALLVGMQALANVEIKGVKLDKDGIHYDFKNRFQEFEALDDDGILTVLLVQRYLLERQYLLSNKENKEELLNTEFSPLKSLLTEALKKADERLSDYIGKYENFSGVSRFREIREGMKTASSLVQTNQPASEFLGLMAKLDQKLRGGIKFNFNYHVIDSNKSEYDVSLSNPSNEFDFLNDFRSNGLVSRSYEQFSFPAGIENFPGGAAISSVDHSPTQSFSGPTFMRERLGWVESLVFVRDNAQAVGEDPAQRMQRAVDEDPRLSAWVKEKKQQGSDPIEIILSKNREAINLLVDESGNCPVQ